MQQRKTKPTVCVAANTSWYIYNFRRRLIGALTNLGYEVVALSPEDRYVQLIEALGVEHVGLGIDSAGTNPLREVATLLRMFVALRQIRPTMLLTYTPKINIYGAIAARALGIPVIANLSGLGRAFVAGGWLESVARRLYGLAMHHPHTIFFQNNEDRATFIEAGLVDPGRSRRIPGSGVDIDRFRPSVRGGNGERFVFLLVGRLLWDKGVGEFVEAARAVKLRFPRTEFRLLGFLDVQNPSAISSSQVEQWQTEGAVQYLGTADEVESHYAAADCVVLPSYYREGVPRTLLEAASMGLPIITTDSAGCRDAVDDGTTGYLVRPRDTADLVDKMQKMLCLPAYQRQAMGQRAREKMCREFDERIVIDHYLNAIREIETVSARS